MEYVKACRACLIISENMNAFTDVVFKEYTLLDLLKKCLIFKEEDNLFPHQFCFECTGIVCKFYDFKIALEKSEQILKEHVENMKNDLNVEVIGIKQEYKNSKTITENVLLDSLSDTCSEYNCLKEELFDPGDNYQVIYYSDYGNNIKPGEHQILKEEIIDSLKHKCIVCKKYFPDKDSLVEHCEHHKKHICEECGASFLKKSYLTDHQISHSKVRKFVCPFCGMKFKRRSIFAAHKRNHTNPREFVCETCGKRFNHRSTMRTHVKLLHIKNRDFMCNLCGLTFPLKASLQKHIVRHNKNAPKLFKCLECEMSYKDKSSLTRHVQIKHSSNKILYRCEPCNKEYTTNTNLRKHIRKKHSDNNSNMETKL